MDVFEMIVMVMGICGLTAITITRQITKGVMSKKLLKKIEELKTQNAELQQRTENIEMLVAGMDTELLENMIELQALENPDTNKDKIKQTADKQREKYGNKSSSDGKQIEESLKSIASKVLKRVDGYLDEAERQSQQKKNEQRWKGY